MYGVSTYDVDVRVVNGWMAGWIMDGWMGCLLICTASFPISSTLLTRICGDRNTLTVVKLQLKANREQKREVWEEGAHLGCGSVA